MMEGKELKDKIREKAFDLGINLVTILLSVQMGGNSNPEAGILAAEYLALGKKCDRAWNSVIFAYDEHYAIHGLSGAL